MRKEYRGAAQLTQLTAGIDDVQLTMELQSTAGWPTGTPGPFVARVTRASDGQQEKMLCSDLTGTTVTIQQRGYDGTSAITLDSGDNVEHLIDAVTIDEANAHVESEHITYSTAATEYYVDPLAGDNSNDGLTLGTALADLDAAVGKVPNVVRNDYTINIVGDLTAATTISRNLHFVGARLIVKGYNAARADSISGAVAIRGSVGMANRLDSGYGWTFRNLSINERLSFHGCDGFDVSDCDLNGDGTYAIVVQSCRGIVRGSSFGVTTGYGILAQYIAEVFVDNCTGGLDYLFYAREGSRITIDCDPTAMYSTYGPRFNNGGLIYENQWRLVGTANNPPFENSWVNYGGAYPTCGFRLQGNTVEFKGLVKSGTVGQHMFTLPLAYRYPLSAIATIAAISSGPVLAQVYSYGADGAFELAPGTGNNTWLSIDGISHPGREI